VPTRAIRLGIVLTLLAGCGPDDLANQPPSLQGLAVSESGPNRFRLVAMANSHDAGNLHSLWQVSRGQIDTPDQMQTELTLPGQPGAYPVRLTVQDANGGVAQALFVFLHDPNGRTELAPATLATFKRDELRTSQTQVVALQHSTASVVPPATPPVNGLRLTGVDIGSTETALAFDAKLQVASVSNDATATWSALSGSFDEASGLKAKWRPAGISGLEAVTLSVADAQGHQSQAIVRLLVDQGIPRESSLDFVQIQDGRLVRQTFAAIPTPKGAALPSPAASGNPALGLNPNAQISGSPSPSGSPSGSPQPGASPSPGASASPSAYASPTASGSPQASGSPASYPTMPPSSNPSGNPTPGTSSSPTPGPSYSPYNPLATPTPQHTPSPSPSASAS
jgi:hypothetical protein